MKAIFKNQMVKATSWSLVQKAGSMVISFFTNMVLARLISPADFGSVGMILTFMSVADLLVDAGLGQSLVQKQNLEQKDISTVFTSNLLLSILFFAIIFVIAPSVADYVGIPNLAIYLRVEAVTVIIRALYVVHNALLNKQLNFKSLAKISIGAAFVSSVIAIVLALFDFGVWSLIVKNISMHIAFCLFFVATIRPHVSLHIDKQSFKQLFGFGWFVSLSSLIDVLYSNIASFVIGKTYSVEQLGYYTQANSLKQIPVYSLSMVISQVLFPTLAKEQQDVERVNAHVQRVVVMSTAVIFPLMICLVVIAEPLIVFLYSAKWLPSVVYFRILCVAGLVNILIHINRSVLMALGKSKLLFAVQVTAILIGFIFIAVAIRYDALIFVGSLAAYSFVNWTLVAIVAGRTIGYRLWHQIRDIGTSLLLALIAGVASYMLMRVMNIESSILSLIVNTAVFATAYITMHLLFRTSVYRILKNSLKKS